jgi:hypothetical protein
MNIKPVLNIVKGMGILSNVLSQICTPLKFNKVFNCLYLVDVFFQEGRMGRSAAGTCGTLPVTALCASTKAVCRNTRCTGWPQTQVSALC